MVDFVPEDVYAPEEKLAQRRGLESNTTGLRYPIWFAACSYKKIKHTFKAPGTRQKETDFIKLATLDNPSSPSLTNHSELKYLSEALAQYMYNFQEHLVEEASDFTCVVCASI
jgi:hypothetical protein